MVNPVHYNYKITIGYHPHIVRAPYDFSQLNGSMVNVVASMDSALKTMDLEKVSFGTNLLSSLSINAFKQAYPFRFKIKQK